MARIILGISAIVALGGLLALVASAGFSDLRGLLFRLSDVEQPSIRAAAGNGGIASPSRHLPLLCDGVR